MAPKKRPRGSTKVVSKIEPPGSISCSIKDAKKCGFCSAINQWINQRMHEDQKRTLKRLESFLDKYTELNELYTKANPIYLMPIPANLSFVKLSTPYLELLTKLDLLCLSYSELQQHGYPHASPYQNYVIVNQKDYGNHVYSGQYTTCPDKQLECARCSVLFCYNNSCQHELCRYHESKPVGGIHACCNQPEWFPGCKHYDSHVWAGVAPGINIYPSFHQTRIPLLSGCRRGKLASLPQIYAIDCEMVYTQIGLELAKVSIVTPDGSLVYNEYVKPIYEVIDYNTKYSGITEKDLASAKSFQQVQTDIRRLINANTYLIGHALNNDLRVLRLIHLRCVDTSVIFKNPSGSRRNPSLKSLAQSILQRAIQTGTNGHDSVEDATVTMKLVLQAVQNDFNRVAFMNFNRV